MTRRDMIIEKLRQRADHGHLLINVDAFYDLTRQCGEVRMSRIKGWLRFFIASGYLTEERGRLAVYKINVMLLGGYD